MPAPARPDASDGSIELMPVRLRARAHTREGSEKASEASGRHTPVRVAITTGRSIADPKSCIFKPFESWVIAGSEPGKRRGKEVPFSPVLNAMERPDLPCSDQKARAMRRRE